MCRLSSSRSEAGARESAAWRQERNERLARVLNESRKPREEESHRGSTSSSSDDPSPAFPTLPMTFDLRLHPRQIRHPHRLIPAAAPRAVEAQTAAGDRSGQKAAFPGYDEAALSAW